MTIGSLTSELAVTYIRPLFNLELAARFVGVDSSVGNFVVSQPGNGPMLKLSVGADILTREHVTVRAYYDGGFGANSRSDSLGMKLSNRLE